MKPSFELDKQIAKYLGWKWNSNYIYDTFSDFAWPRYSDLYTKDNLREKIPFYSYSIKYAWEIVEKFRTGKYHKDKVACCVEMIVYDSDSLDCYCKVYAPDLAPVEAFAESMPLAICEVYLKIMEEI